MKNEKPDSIRTHMESHVCGRFPTFMSVHWVPSPRTMLFSSPLPGEIPPILLGVIGIPAFEEPFPSKNPGNPPLSLHALSVGSKWVSPEQFNCPGVSHICRLTNSSLGFEVGLPLGQDEENKSFVRRQSSKLCLFFPVRFLSSPNRLSFTPFSSSCRAIAGWTEDSS